MLTIYQFNAEALAHYVSRAFVLRRGTEWRLAAVAVAQSQVLIANADFLLTINAMRPGYSWLQQATFDYPQI